MSKTSCSVINILVFVLWIGMLISIVRVGFGHEGPGCGHDEVQRSTFKLHALSPGSSSKPEDNEGKSHWPVKLSSSTVRKLVGIHKYTGEHLHEDVEEVYTTMMVRLPNDTNVHFLNEPKPFNIYFSKNNLADNSYSYCHGSWSRDKYVPDLKGGWLRCGETKYNRYLYSGTRDNIYTMLTAATRYFSKILSAKTIYGRISVRNQICGSQYEYSTSDSTGVVNADIVIIASAAPSDDMWSGICAMSESGRPVVGKINIPPSIIPEHMGDYLKRSSQRHLNHHVIHALGFTINYIQSMYFKTNLTFGTELRRNLVVNIYIGPAAVAQARDYFNCPNIIGVMWVDGNLTSVKSHWHLREHYDDAMSANAQLLSTQTLGLLEDSGHYTVDYTRAELNQWGRKSGCGFIYSSCNTKEGGLGKEFCSKVSRTEYKCAFDYFSYGICGEGTVNEDNLPTIVVNYKSSKGPYDLNNCSIITPVYNCGEGLRCAQLTRPKRVICLKMRCTPDGLVQINNYANLYEECEYDGAYVKDHYPQPNIYIVCPPAGVICAYDVPLSFAVNDSILHYVTLLIGVIVTCMSIMWL